jgi:hypothetical protein
MQRGVGRTVAAAIEPMPIGATGAGGDWRRRAQVGERRLAAQTFGIVAGGDEQLAGDLHTDTEQRGRARRGPGGKPPESSVRIVDLVAEHADATGQRAERSFRRDGWIRGALAVDAEGGTASDQGGLGQARQRFAEVSWSAYKQAPELVQRGGAGLDRATAGDAQHSNGLHRAGARLRNPVGPSGQRGPRGRELERIGLALAAAGSRLRPSRSGLSGHDARGHEPRQPDSQLDERHRGDKQPAVAQDHVVEATARP